MATYISNQTGLWNTASTWLTAAAGTTSPAAAAGAAPQSGGGDKIIIRTPHVVTYNTVGVFGDETSTYATGAPTGAVLTSILNNAIILSGGTLKADRTTNTELTARGTIYIAPSGTLDWGTAVDPISTVNSTITLHYMTQLSALSASVAAAGIYLHGSAVDNLGLYNNIYLSGKPRLRNTTLSAPATSGSTVISVVSAAGWQVGDRLVVASELISNISSTTVGVLSSTVIQSITGNNITISPGLNNSRSTGTCVGNFTSNVNIRSYNPLYASFGMFLYTSIGNTIDINNIKLDSMGSGVTTPVGWMPYSYTGTRATAAQTGLPLGSLSINNTFSQIPTYTLKGVVIENPIGTPFNYSIHVVGKLSETITLDDCAAFSTNTTSYLCFFNSQAVGYFKGCTVYRSTNGVFCGSAVPNTITIEGSNLDASTSPLATSLNGLTMSINNSKLRGISYISPLDAIQSANIKNSRLYHNSATGAIINSNVNASGSLNFSSCTFYYGTTPLSLVTKTAVSQGNKTAQSAEITVFQANGDAYDFRKFNYYHYSQADLIMRKRGITSFKIKPEIANTEFYNYFKTAGIINTPQTLKGSLRFDSAYGVTNPPSISFVGAGVNQTFTCGPTANMWQDFAVTYTPTITDDVLITLTCKSSATSGYAWLDGLPIYPYIQTVRHYGYVFDNNTYRTTNTHNTLSAETDVAALSAINNMNYLYDAATYWTVVNPASSYYIDVVNFDGTILDFGDKNVVVDAAAVSAFEYNINTNTITIKTTSLSSGSMFDTLMSTGYLSVINTASVGSSVVVRTSNYDSELVYSGADNIVLYPSLSDAQNTTNPGPSASNGVLRFLYGQTLQGVVLSGNTYIKWTAGSFSDVYTGTISQGHNELGDLSTQAGLAIAISNLNVINQGVQKTSILTPHAADVSLPTGLSVQVQTLINDQQIVNEGVKKASKLIPHTTNLS